MQKAKLIHYRKVKMLLSYLVKYAVVAIALAAPVNIAVASCPCDDPNSNAETQQEPLPENTQDQ